MAWLGYIFSGIISGFAGGLFGIGGGVILVPTLIFCYTFQGAARAPTAKVAIATSLATIVLLSMSSTWAHWRQRAIDFREVAWLASFGAAGAWLGSEIAIGVDGDVLLSGFGILQIIVGTRMLLGKKPPPDIDIGDVAASVRNRRLALTGAISGIVSSLFGVGGGIVAVPLQVFAGIPIHRAIGNSSAMIVINATVGTLRFLTAPQLEVGANAIVVGHVDLYAVAILGAVAVVSAQLGARAAHRLESDLLKRVFGVGVILLGLLFATKSI